MTQRRPLLSRIPSRILSIVQRYGLAVSSVAIALGIARFLFNHQIEGVESLVFLIAITVTVWYAGMGPAILALVLATLARSDRKTV